MPHPGRKEEGLALMRKVALTKAGSVRASGFSLRPFQMRHTALNRGIMFC
ncbi:MAG: hypothetical protein H7Y38_01805 [Armatimonadetes bacterium]|nr:hypothetical protein [Armatimonadota bacterium]